MVDNYNLQTCTYMLGSLKPHIMLLPFETTKIDYIVENYPTTINNNTVYIGKCEVKKIYADSVIKIEGFSTVANVNESENKRLQFSTSVNFSMRENYDDEFVSLLNLIKLGRYYVVVEDLMGNQYIQSPEFTSAFNYNYNFSTASNDTHNTELIFRSDSNNPLVILNERITATQVITESCEYQNGIIKNFKLCPYQFAFIDNNPQTGKFTKVTVTGGETMHKVEFVPNSFRFTQSYDGEKYQEKLVFRIPLSDYKYYFRYNLVAFKHNRYAMVFETGKSWIASGFEFGHSVSYSIETSEESQELNLIEITLHHVGQNSIFYSDRDPQIINSETNVSVPVSQQIKDPVTGIMLSNYKCISKTEAIYTLLQMVTESGVPTDSYMCLQGYEQYYNNINIVGTYSENSHFDFELKFSNYDCAKVDNCVFSKMTKKIYTFSNTGDYYFVHIMNNCPWTLEDIPSWISASITSGEGGVDYTLRFTSKEDAGEQMKISYGYLKSADNRTTIQFILEKKVEWINPIEHRINAMNQTVTSYVNLGYNDYEICETPANVTVEKIRGTSTLRIRVPENNDENNMARYTIGLCNILNGEKGYIYIYQDHLYVRWAEDSGTYICVNGTSYKKVVKYKGYDENNINILTNEYTTGTKLVDNDERCKTDGGDGDKYAYQWRNVNGTICIGTDLYSKQQKWETFDGGLSWNSTEEYKQGELIENGSSQCQELPEKKYKMIVDESQYECLGTESYYMQCKWWSYDNIEWYKTDEECNISTKLRKSNDPACGGGGTQPSYNEKWERSTETYCKDGFLFYLERKYTSNDGGITWSETDEYREGNVNSGQSCIDSDKGYAWRIDYGEYVCDGYNSYYVEKYYYYYNANPSVYILIEPLQKRKSQTLRKSNDPACGYVDQRKYRWNTNTGETICQGDDLYTREDYEYSDDGETWHKTGNVRIGTLVKENSENCINTTKHYEWRVDKTRWICVGTKSYYYEVRYESTDNVNWIPSVPEVIQQSQTVRLENDPECGASTITFRWVEDGNNYLCEYEDGEPKEQTRWVSMPKSEWVCDGFSLREIEKEQKSSDYGNTWTDTGNTRQGDEFEKDSPKCAYKTDYVYQTENFAVRWYGKDETTKAQGIYLYYRTSYYNRYEGFEPMLRVVTNSPQGNSWYTVTLSSYTIEAETVPAYFISIKSNLDVGTINYYWEIYNRTNNEVWHTSKTWTITRQSQ